MGSPPDGASKVIAQMIERLVDIRDRTIQSYPWGSQVNAHTGIRQRSNRVAYACPAELQQDIELEKECRQWTWTSYIKREAIARSAAKHGKRQTSIQIRIFISTKNLQHQTNSQQGRSNASRQKTQDRRQEYNFPDERGPGEMEPYRFNSTRKTIPSTINPATQQDE